MAGGSLSRRAFLGGTAAVTLTLAGCGSDGGSAGSGGKALRLFTYESDDTIDLLKSQVAKFDSTGGVKTTVNSLPGSGAAIYPDKLRTELLGGKGPDIWRIWGGQIGSPFAQAKQAADLSPYYEKYKWADRINKAAIDGMTFDGMKAGLPFTSFAMGLWYNDKLFKKAGITSEPTSYAELEEANDKLVRSGVMPGGFAGKYGWHVMRLFEYLLEVSAGPELHDKLLVGSESWDRPEVVEAFTKFKRWQDKKWIPEGALGLDPNDMEPWVIQGRCAYTFTSTSFEANQVIPSKQPPSDYGTMLAPTDHDPERFSGFVEGYMINAKSENKDKAAELLDFLLKPETQEALHITSSTVSGADPDPKKYPLSAKWTPIKKDHSFFTIQDQAFPKQQADSYFTVQSDILQGKVTPAGAAKKMQEIVSQWAKK